MWLIVTDIFLCVWMKILEILISWMADHCRNDDLWCGLHNRNCDLVWETITEMVISCVGDNYRNDDLLCR